jgi:hypothetical protein
MKRKSKKMAAQDLALTTDFERLTARYPADPRGRYKGIPQKLIIDLWTQLKVTCCQSGDPLHDRVLGRWTLKQVASWIMTQQIAWDEQGEYRLFMEAGGQYIRSRRNAS